MKWLIVVILSFFSGYLYRLGGLSYKNAQEKELYRWLPKWAVNTKARDIGVALVACLTMGALGDFPFWVHVVHFVFLFATLTTYWEHWGSEGVEWYEWLLTGFFYCVPAIVYSLYLHSPIGFLLRISVVSVFICLWSELISNADWEEWGRGISITLSLIMLI